MSAMSVMYSATGHNGKHTAGSVRHRGTIVLPQTLICVYSSHVLQADAQK